jgi:Flp pilus assembly protein TadG
MDRCSFVGEWILVRPSCLLKRLRRGRRTSERRRGAVAVEAAVVLPMALIFLFGTWEVGRIVQVNQLLYNAAREGARLAAGGSNAGTQVTLSMVQQAVRDYMTAAGLPSTAVSGAQITLTCLATPAWTDPYQAQPLDKFQVTVTIPSGAPFNSLRWSLVNQLTSVNSLSATVNWQSLNNSQVVVNTALPY